MKATRACSIDGCERPHKGRGYCRVHLDRVKRTGKPGPAEIRVYGSPGCSMDGCTAEHVAQGLCDRHYARLRKHGDPAHFVPRFGEHSPNWRAEGVGYSAAHYRVKVAKGGPASEHFCRCGMRASEWAYDHADPNELSSVQNGYLVAYSLDPDHYLPMCRNCHRQLDADHAAERRADA